MLGSGIDPQLAKVANKLPGGLQPFSSTALHTVSGSAINGILSGHLSLEDAAAHMLSNSISTAITPGLMHGLEWADKTVFNSRAAREQTRQQSAQLSPVTKSTNASKENVHRLPAVQRKPNLSPQEFMRKMSLEGEMSAFDEVWEQFFDGPTENRGSYIPSLYEGSNRQPIHDTRSAMWENIQHWVEGKLEAHPKLFKFLQRHENVVVGINNVLTDADVRLYGALRAEAGVGMMLLGSMGGPLGLPLMSLGADNVQAGTYQSVTAKETRTLLTNQLQNHLHLSDTQANILELGLSGSAAAVSVYGKRIAESVGNSPFTLFGSRGNSASKNIADIAVVPNNILARAEIIEESNLRSKYLQQKYSHFTSTQRQARINELALGNRVLREQGVPHQFISQSLQSFELGTIQVRIADESTYGLRFYGGVSKPKGAYMNPTFPLGNVRGLNALPVENEITKLMQWQLSPGSTYLFGRIRTNFGQPGGGLQIYIPNFENDLMKPKW